MTRCIWLWRAAQVNELAARDSQNVFPLPIHYPTRLDLEIIQAFVTDATLRAERADSWLPAVQHLEQLDYPASPTTLARRFNGHLPDAI